MKMSVRLLIAVLLLHSCLGVVPAQDIAEKADEYLAAQAKVNHFMGSVLIARDGEPIFRKGYGLANVEHDVPNRPETKYRLGSLTKQFTAAAVLLLQERGKLEVGDPIGQYIGDAPESWEDVTIHHLLTHTSGIPSFTSFPEYEETWMIPSRPEETMLRFRNEPLEFRPGRKFSYSNSGYILLALIIENVSGMRYGEFLEENVFGPLGMRDSGHDSHEAILKRIAKH